MKKISNQENCTNHYYPNENLCNCYQFIPRPTGPTHALKSESNEKVLKIMMKHF